MEHGAATNISNPDTLGPDQCPLCFAREVPVCFERESGTKYHRCGCGMVFIQNDAPVDHYPVNALSGWRRKFGFTFDYRSNKLWAVARSHIRWLHSYLDDAGLPETKRAMSLGCAYGHDLRELKDAGWDVLGVDHDDSFAERARRQHGIEVRTSFVEDLAPEETFDLVVMASVLPYLSGVQDIMARVSRLVKPGGYVFVITRCIDFCDISEVLSYPMNVHARQYLTTRGLERLVGAHGFEPVVHDCFQVQHPRIAGLAAKAPAGAARKAAEQAANLGYLLFNAMGRDCYRPEQNNRANLLRFLAQRKA